MMMQIERSFLLAPVCVIVAAQSPAIAVIRSEFKEDASVNDMHVKFSDLSCER